MFGWSGNLSGLQQFRLNASPGNWRFTVCMFEEHILQTNVSDKTKTMPNVFGLSRLVQM